MKTTKNMKTEYRHFYNTFFVKIENGKSILIYLGKKVEYYDYVLNSFSDYEKSNIEAFMNAFNETIFAINEKLIKGL